MDKREIKALISLIDDPDENIYQQVRNKIVSFGEDIIPTLENVWEESLFGNVFQDRIEDIIHKIQFDSIYNQLEQWGASEDQDLLKGALLVARYQYPDLNESEVRNRIQRIRQDIWLELNDNLTALERVKIFNHILFKNHGFKGNKQNYHAPQNSYINNVLESHRGNPLSLSILYIILAESLDTPIYGVNLPNHFILAYVDKYDIMRLINKHQNQDKTEEDGVLFYINPFSSGSILHRSEIDSFLKHLNIDQDPVFYNPCDNKSIIIRVINNLVHSYDRLGYPEKVEELQMLMNALNLSRRSEEA